MYPLFRRGTSTGPDMRILIVNSGLRFGGAERQIVEISKELVLRGHAVAIYTLTNDVPRLPQLKGSGVEVVVDNKRARLDVGVLRRLRRFIRNWQADIVHGFLFDGNLYSRLAAIGLGVPVLNSERNDNYTLRRSQVLAHRPTRFLANGVVANTRAGARFAGRLFNLAAARVHVVGNGIRLQEVADRLVASTRRYKQEFFGTDKVKVACLVGTIMPSKDTLLALHTAHALIQNDPEWRVLFIGDTQEALSYTCDDASSGWNYKKQVMDTHDRLGLRDHVNFIGQRSDALEIIAQCDVLFSTSVHEGFPNVVLEAMAVGTPVASVDYSDIRHILPLPWQVAGARDVGQLAVAIRRAVDEHDAVSMVQRDWVRRHATLEVAAANMEAVYRQYVKARD